MDQEQLLKYLEYNLKLKDIKNLNRVTTRNVFSNYWRVNVWINDVDFGPKISKSYFLKVEDSQDGLIVTPHLEKYNE